MLIGHTLKFDEIIGYFAIADITSREFKRTFSADENSQGNLSELGLTYGYNGDAQ